MVATMDLRDALGAAVAQERALRDKRDAIDKELADLEVEVRGLRMAMERYSREAPGQDQLPIEVSGAPDPEELHGAARTDAIEAVLASATEPMSPTAIVARLHDLGRDDNYSAVSAALAYLHRTHRVHSVGRGQWVLGHNDEELAPTGDEPS
jgi:hypothetical protein